MFSKRRVKLVWKWFSLLQDSRHRSPEKGRDAEGKYSFEISTVKMDRPCYQNA